MSHADRMNPRLSSIALWATCLAIAFTAGYFVGSPNTGVEDRIGDARPSHTTGRNDGSHHESSTHSGSNSGLRTSDTFHNSEARAQTFEMLREPDRMERVRKLCNLLATVTRENWRDVFEGFRRQAAVEGRIGDEEWNLMLRQIGRVAGADAMKFLESEKLDEPNKVLTVYSGWAETDPRAAKAWGGNNIHQLDSTQRSEAFYRGAASGDPEVALEIAFETPQTKRVYEIIIEGAIQRGGLKGADELVTSVLTDKSSAQEKFGQRGWLFGALVESHIKAARSANDPARVLGWLDAHLGQQYIDGEAVYHATHYAAEANPSTTLDWISDRADRMTEQHAWWCVRDAADAWRKKDSDQFAEWVKTNADHPLLERIVTGAWAAPVIYHGQGETARRWAAKIESPSISGLVESWIKEADIQKQKESESAVSR